MTLPKNKYSKEEILEIFKEQHRLCSSLDPEADPLAIIHSDMTIKEWRLANDLVPWKKLSEYLNQEFKINIDEKEWCKILVPESSKKLIGVCGIIADNAVKDEFEPKNLFGTPCIKAAVFLTLKKNLKNKGVDVSNLKPSSLISEYLEKYFTPTLEEITLTGTKPIKEINVKLKKSGFWNAINIFDKDRYEITFSNLVTFRDLTEKIIELKKLN